MLMSEAIILGSVLCPQSFVSIKTQEGGRCAIGAAGHALGFDFKNSFEAAAAWPAMSDETRSLIIFLNDNRRLPLCAIARWLVESGKDFEVKPRLPENAPVCTDQAHAGGELVVTT